jgi:hypothetical protein
MRDPDIRAALVARLRAGHPDVTENVIRPEMAVGLGASRVDVALVNGRLTGYEIKSDHDNLDRLPSQVEHYGRCLDRAIVVVSERRAHTIRDHVPPWWGVWSAIPDGAGVCLKERRRGRRNPGLDPFYVAQLLWREEARAELVARGHAVPSKATRWDLWDQLATLPLTELRDAVRARLKARA